MRTELAGRTAVVLGASAGIGRAIAERLAGNGATTVVNGASQRGADVAEEIRRNGGTADFIQADMQDFSAVQALADEVVRRYGRLDIVVVSGAPSQPITSFFADCDPGCYLDYMKSRFATRMYAIRAALPHMQANGYGKVVLITSDAGRVATPGEVMSGAAWAAVHQAAKALAIEVARWGIRINTIATTVTQDTPGYHRVLQSPMGEKVFKKAERRMPFWPLLPDDVAGLAVFLASPDSDRITGQIFSVNGGLSVLG